MTNCTIKIADFKEISNLHGAIPEFEPQNAGHFEKRCENVPYLALGAYIDERPAGYAVCYDRYRDGSFYIWMAGTLPEARQKGVYSQIYKYIEDWAAKNGYQNLKIKTRNNRREMLYWLVKNGFEFTEVDKREPIADSRIHLIKKLPAKNAAPDE